MAVGNRTVTIYGNGWKSRWFPAEFDDISHIIFWSLLYGYEKETIPVILDQVRQARCFIDVGANCGIYTVLERRLTRAQGLSRLNRCPKSARR